MISSTYVVLSAPVWYPKVICRVQADHLANAQGASSCFFCPSFSSYRKNNRNKTTHEFSFPQRIRCILNFRHLRFAQNIYALRDQLWSKKLPLLILVKNYCKEKLSLKVKRIQVLLLYYWSTFRFGFIFKT